MSEADALPVAGTAVLLRDAAEGLEVLLMRRPPRGSFADAWVFPGGKVEEDDRVAGALELDDARRAAVREVTEEVGLVVDGLVVLSCWEPPVEAPTRIRTWFFVGEAPEQELRLAPDEVADARWVRPAEALARHGAGEWMLFPPTWMTLHRLTECVDVDAVMSGVDMPEFFRTRVEDTAAGRVFRWDELRLEAGSLPWRLRAPGQASSGSAGVSGHRSQRASG